MFSCWESGFDPRERFNRRPLLLNDSGASRQDDQVARIAATTRRARLARPTNGPWRPEASSSLGTERSALGRALVSRFPLHGVGARSGGGAGEALPPASPEVIICTSSILHVRVRK